MNRIVGALALVGSLAITSVLPAAASPTDSPAPPTAAAATDQAVAWGNDAAHTGSQPGDPLAPPLTKSWVDDLGGDVAFPIIAAGRVYVTAKTQASTRLIALEAATGQLDWMIDLGGGRLAANVAYDNGRVFVDNGNGLVMAFDAQTGARDWIKVGGGTMVTPFNGVLYSGISAFDEATGAYLWHAQPAGTNPPPLQGTAGPAVTSSGMYLSTGCADAWDFSTPAASTRAAA
ncbi:MAG: hypothetical protein E6I78_14360 [Chloroflexi bacterium]|nr:MAG: hypothetical protein E6I78_14360 [Chloroflexota bacterium]